MAKRILAITSITPVAFADSTNLVDAQYVGIIQGGSGTQRIKILEVWETGLAGSSAPTLMLLSRDSTIGVTISLGTGLTDAAIDAATAALAAPPLVGNTCTTKPQRSATLHLWNLAFNAFGGEVRYHAAPDEEPTIVGNTASLGEVSLSAFTGGTPGLFGSHLIYESL